MFEQFYDQPTTEEKPQEGELFQSYEIKNWNYSKRIYQILAISAALNIFGLIFLGQTEVLTAKGCDSPFVGRVCQVLDTVYVGSLLLGTDREYVDAVYDKVDLGDAEITYIDVSGETPPLSYPEGYFQIANPVQYAMLQQQASDPMAGFSPTTPGFTPNPTIGNDIMNTRPNLPKPNTNQGGDPDSSYVLEGESPTIRKGSRKGGRRLGNGKVSDDTVAQVTPTPTPDETPKATTTDPVTGDVINDRPMSDLATFVNEIINKKEANLESEFILKAKGKLTKDGKLDPNSFKYLKTESADKKLIEIVQESIEAFSDSGRLKILERLSGKDLNLQVQQDGINISAIIQSEVESETRANALKSSFDLLLAGAKALKSGSDASQNDKDDLVLLNGAKIESKGKTLTIHFLVPKELVHQMIQRKLAKQAAEVKKENGTAQIKPNDNTAK